MIEGLLLPQVQEFIQQHLHDDPNTLMLKYTTIHGVDTRLVVDQIVGRRKAREKLPTFGTHAGIVFPPAVNLAQSSSELTAHYKCTLLKKVPDLSFQSCADVTGGFGVDSLSLSQIFEQVHYVESNESLLHLAAHNHRALNASNIIHHHAEAKPFLSHNDRAYDLVFVDPDRRDQGSRKFLLQDCRPDIIQLQKIWFDRCSFVLIKTSPMLDISQALRQIDHVSRVFVVSVDNECRELLFLCQEGFSGEPEVVASDLTHSSVTEFEFLLSGEGHQELSITEPSVYLFEPSASVLKAGAVRSLARRFNLSKLHSNTHLLTSDVPCPGFQGRTFKIVAITKPRLLDSYFPEGKANIIQRNSGLSVEEIKARTGLKDGGSGFLIVCRSMTGLRWIVAERVPTATV